VLELERASALIEETGARIFEPVLNSAKQVKEERQAASRRTVI
jgi:hypothetical protein